MDETESSTRLGCCCHRQTYVYLYTPKMNETRPSTRCLICSIIVLCLVVFTILLGLIFYYQTNQQIQLRRGTIAAKRHQLPEFVNETIDPCEDFYSFICQSSTQNETNFLHHRLISTENQPNFVSQWFKMCRTSSSDQLVDEVKFYFENLTRDEPFRSFLTLFHREKNVTTNSTRIEFVENPFFTIISNPSNNTVTFVRRSRRSLPTVTQILTNSSRFDYFALNDLIQFEKDYEQLLDDEFQRIQFYESEYDEDSLIIQRILSFPSYDMCETQLNQTNGFDKFIFLLKKFLRQRLKEFNTKFIDKQIALLSKMNDNHTLVTNLRHIYSELKMIEKILSIDRQNSCILNLCEEFLDRRLKYSELPFDLHRYVSPNSTFISTDWPFLAMLSDRLLKKTSLNTIVNYAYFHSYRQIIYPYYQPHLLNEKIVYKNADQLCIIENCFDVLNCFHPSILNELAEKENQVDLEEKKIQVENLLDRIRRLIEQSDYLYFLEKRSMLDELNRIEIRLGHFSSSSSFSSFPRRFTKKFSYLDSIRYLSSLPFDKNERSYETRPMFFSRQHVLYLPYAFVSKSNDRSFDYSIAKLILTILRQTIDSDPFHVECLISPSDDDLHVNDEDILYLFFRSKFLSDEQIVVDEYLWPYMSSNWSMKRFLIDYSASNYCSMKNAKQIISTHQYLQNDIELLFQCQKKKFREQMNCQVI